MRRGKPWAWRIAGLAAALWATDAGAACELPSPPAAARPGPVYRVVSGPSRVRLDAKAFLHDFAGTTSKVEGLIRVGDLDRLGDARACIRIDAASLDTGNGIRDGIMRDDHLETGKFPTIDFDLKQVEEVKRRPGNWEFVAHGILTLHGVSREISIPIRARQEDDAIRLAGELPLKMTDYGIRIPRFLFFTVEDQVMLSFSLTAERTQ